LDYEGGLVRVDVKIHVNKRMAEFGILFYWGECIVKRWRNSMNSLSRRTFVILNIVILVASFVVMLVQPTTASATCGTSTRVFDIFSVPVEKGDVITVTLTSSGTGNNVFSGMFLGTPYTSSNANPAVFSATAASAGTFSVTFAVASSAGSVFTVHFACNESLSFNPGDGRVDPQAGDRLVIWCNTSGSTPNLLIYGVGSDSKGIFLATVNFADLLKAGNSRLAQLDKQYKALLNGQTPANGKPLALELKRLEAEIEREAQLSVLTVNLRSNGALTVIVDEQNNFVISWTSGPFNANGQGVWAKSFKCDFKR
jgi:hypothetical protein